MRDRSRSFGDCDGDPAAAKPTSPEMRARAVCGAACAGSCVSGSCQTVCGDAQIAGDEQCDDSNTKAGRLRCRLSLQAFTRMNQLNRGGDRPELLHPAYEPIRTGVSRWRGGSAESGGFAGRGSLNLLLQLVNLDDLTGGTRASLSQGSPALDPAHPGAWSAGAIDWFLADPASIDAEVTLWPCSPARASRGALSLDAPQMALPFGRLQPGDLSAHLRAAVDAVPAPDVPAPPPAALARAGSFRSLGAAGSGRGLCGNATVSLAKFTEDLASGGISACVEPSQVLASQPQHLACLHVVWRHCASQGNRTMTPPAAARASRRCHSNLVSSGCNSLLDDGQWLHRQSPTACKPSFPPARRARRPAAEGLGG